MSADNAVLARIEDQDEATRRGFYDVDLKLAVALGFDRRMGCGTGDSDFNVVWHDANSVAELRRERVNIAARLMAAQLSNPNARQSIAGMAEWAVLGADILLNKLATQRAVHVGATPPA